jgi:deoxyribodipyrimidine photolyase
MHLFDQSLVWYRRDLRSFDHAALYQALKQSRISAFSIRLHNQKHLIRMENSFAAIFRN